MINIEGLYQINGKHGGYIIRNLTGVEGFDATVEALLVGEGEVYYPSGPSNWLRVAVEDVQPYTADNAWPAKWPGEIVSLAQEAVCVYGLDPWLVSTAAQIVHRRFSIVQARRDERGVDIQPSLEVIAVETDSKRGWHVVRPGHCTCGDNGICKHRTAAWLYKEAIIRPLAAARRTTSTQIMAELASA